MAPHGHALSDMSSADFLNSARVPYNAIVTTCSNDIVLLKLARRGRNEPMPYGDGSP
jgi:hypothetical protein